ncbi:hypothetical protein GJ633_09570 [Halorubrum sp. CBA1125]|uniref:HalOD1 output domain-containing protein n=1 Tax=Halorubrum sp. CBA1125 TaxID=2668072 RepID=UPI0012E88462|nr:HalOD1 output domain-containing protein [Halorubrum sp. CBA1125]MUW14884.1 hypothetical protein [Halorubrum sp. CBA1125]
MEQTILDQISEGIADVEGVDPADLDISLQRYISTDAIQDLVHHESNAWRLQFETPNHVVEVTGADKILIDGTQIDTDN